MGLNDKRGARQAPPCSSHRGNGLRARLYRRTTHLVFCGMTLHIETDRETDGRWIAEVVEIPGVMAYGDTEAAAVAAALRIAAITFETKDDK
jgi:predicted RNase H-like HicB family nuclease